MPDFKPRTHARNGHRWRTVSGTAKRRWLREGAVTCHLCLRAIDLDAPAKSSWSLSVDHKIPVSVDPSLEYSLNNLAPACWICNTVRQDRPLEMVRADPALFRREVDAALERRQIREAKAAAEQTTGTTRTTSRHWCGAWTDKSGVYHPAFCQPGCEWAEFSPEAASARDWL